VLTAVANVPTAQRYGDNKVWIHDVWAEYLKLPGAIKMTLNGFKLLIVDEYALRSRMARADLVQAMAPADVEASDTHYRSGSRILGTFNFFKLKAATAEPSSPTIPPLPTFGPSQATVLVPGGDDEKAIEASVKKVLGPKATLRDAASATGATDDATVTVMHDEWSDKKKVYVTITSDDYKAYRTIWKTNLGQIVVGADSFYVSEAMKGKGVIGPRVFGRMVEQCARLGISSIKTDASRAGEDNGYYTWPRFGYDGPLSFETKDKLPESLKNAKTVQDLFATPEGIEWWKTNGETIKLEFDLAPGSLSRERWETYLRAKQNAGRSSATSLPTTSP
jgi:hypothetical protein